ncbi:hypothetical protein [Streptomonospora arabica]|uniref:Integral membrane protein n=1 Tax=Streptomonospora arabica TaxID=412417 RepID=A0ABV9SQA1_9ACTN
MPTPDHGPARPPVPPSAPGGSGQPYGPGHQPPPGDGPPAAPWTGHPRPPSGSSPIGPGYPPAAPQYPAPYPAGPAYPYAPRPEKSGQPGAVIAARICAFVFGGFLMLTGLVFGLAAVGARFDSAMGTDAERVSNEIGIGALALVTAAVLYFVVGGIGGCRSSAVPWGSLVAFAVVAGAGVACLAVSPGTAMLALLGAAPGPILLTLLLVPPSRRYYASAPGPTG